MIGRFGDRVDSLNLSKSKLVYYKYIPFLQTPLVLLLASYSIK